MKGKKSIDRVSHSRARGYRQNKKAPKGVASGVNLGHQSCSRHMKKPNCMGFGK
jgi:hypothetical protein